MSFNDLFLNRNRDIVPNIVFSNLNWLDLRNCNSVCRAWNNFIKENGIMRKNEANRIVDNIGEDLKPVKTKQYSIC